MDLAYSKNFEKAIFILTSVLQRNIEYKIDDVLKTVPVVFDEKDKDVNFYLYSDNRVDGVEFNNILPRASVKLTDVNTIPDFKMQKGLRANIYGKNQFTPIITECSFEVTYYAELKSTLFAILEQILVLFDPEVVVKANYSDQFTVSTNIVRLSKSIELYAESGEEDDEINAFTCEFKVTPVIIPKVRRDESEYEVVVELSIK